MNTNPTDTFETEIIADLRIRMANGDDINVLDVVLSLDIDTTHKKVQQWLIQNQICDKAEYRSALKQGNIKRALGFIPKTASELVAKWIEANEIEVNYQKAMKQARAPMLDGVAITTEARESALVDSMARIEENAEINIASLARDLRMAVAEHGMRFTKVEIDDALDKWFEASLKQRIAEVFTTVAFAGSPNSAAKRSAWDAVVSQFDVTETSPEFVEAILRKFIWQVKRKMIGLPVSNHLMPVILGPQGVGKSTFVRDIFLKPISELTGNTDFKMIEEERNTEQWRNFALFLDEMGYADKADIDNVKNKITAVSVTGRPMGTNFNVQYRQNATFIGCSNKELNQLIRDETGNRRFAALRFSSNPDWSKTDAIVPTLLWLSVDERGDDPTKEIADQLRAQQESVREKSIVEQWLSEWQMPLAYKGKALNAAKLYDEFKTWAEQYGVGRPMGLIAFGKEFVRLVNAGQITGWKLGRKNNATTYECM